MRADELAVTGQEIYSDINRFHILSPDVWNRFTEKNHEL